MCEGEGDMENLETRVAEMFRRDARAPRILIAEITAVYWSLLLRCGDLRWLPVWEDFLKSAVDAGIRTAETEFDLAAEMQAAKPAKKKRR
jgi:hypothetical protein